MYKFTAHTAALENTVNQALEKFKQENIMERIWNRDYTVWADSPEEISNRLGWLKAPEKYYTNIEELKSFATEVKNAGITDIMLLGMGGSSLAPEVFSRIFGSAPGYPKLQILDSTDPGMVLARQQSISPESTLFIVATKSGGTVETLSFFKYFYNWTIKRLGKEKAGEHFIAITDPGSKLEALAKTFNFRKTFINDPDIGGRYSALSLFGLVPAALIGINLELLLQAAIDETKNSDAITAGIMMAEAAKIGRDKMTFITSASLESFGDWAEQLIAESTGKAAKGILPVVDEDLGHPDIYQNDRLFIQVKLAGESAEDEKIKALQKAGHPIIQIQLENKAELGAQLFLWEMATAIASWGLKIHPFNQPNVESAKILARDMVTAYFESGKLPESETGKFDLNTLKVFLSQITPNDYISIHAYLPHNAEVTEQLHTLQLKIRDRYKTATTVGFGPRFLHSTGQLHKGDGGNGLFIQLVSKAKDDLPIPDEIGEEHSKMSFDVLKHSQALGDAQALRNENRLVITFEINDNQIIEISKIAEGL